MTGAGARPVRVLVVDDDAATLGMLGIYLKQEGYDVLAASDGAAALACLDTHHPDVILTDLYMPIVDGSSLLAVLRRDPDSRLGEIPVVVLTAASDADVGRVAGAAAVLRKPVEPTAILEALRRVLGGAAGADGGEGALPTP